MERIKYSCDECALMCRLSIDGDTVPKGCPIIDEKDIKPKWQLAESN